MKRIILPLFLFVGVSCADPLGDEVAALKLTLPAGKQLSSNELRQVVELAHLGGMKRVTTVEPVLDGDRHPFLKLTSLELTEGRRISREELSIYNEEWHSTTPTAGRQLKKHGKFMLDSRTSYVGAPYKRQWAMFTIHRKETRLECSSEIDLAEADKIFAAIAANRIDYESKSGIGGISLKQAPTSIGLWSDGRIHIGLRNRDPLCSDFVVGKLNGDRFVIGKADTGCA